METVLIYRSRTLPAYMWDGMGHDLGKGRSASRVRVGPTMTRRDGVCTIFSFIVMLKFLNSVYPPPPPPPFFKIFFFPTQFK